MALPHRPQVNKIENIYLFEKKNMETSVKTGSAQISLIAQTILSRPKIWGVLLGIYRLC